MPAWFLPLMFGGTFVAGMAAGVAAMCVWTCRTGPDVEAVLRRAARRADAEPRG